MRGHSEAIFYVKLRESKFIPNTRRRTTLYAADFFCFYWIHGPLYLFIMDDFKQIWPILVNFGQQAFRGVAWSSRRGRWCRTNFPTEQGEGKCKYLKLKNFCDKISKLMMISTLTLITLKSKIITNFGEKSQHFPWFFFKNPESQAWKFCPELETLVIREQKSKEKMINYYFVTYSHSSSI